MLAKIFAYTLNGGISGSGTKGMIDQIYKLGIGLNCSGQDRECPEISYSDKGASVIQQAQALGLSLMQGVIKNMLDIFQTSRFQLKSIGDQAKDEMDSIENTYLGSAIGAGITGFFFPSAANLWNSIAQAQAALSMAKMSAQFVSKISDFSISLILLPLIFFVMVTVFSIGVSFSLIMPLTPFILFWAGKISWLLLLIEAFFAAPIVALGLVSPEGHFAFGKSSPAIQIGFNLILRPAFMICGLTVGLALTYIIVTISAKGFHTIADQLLKFIPTYQTAASNYAQGIFSLLLIFSYSTFLMFCFTKCFSLIYQLPDKVLHWIGFSGQERAGESEMQQFQSSVTQNAQAAGSAGQSSVDKGIQTYEKSTESHKAAQENVTQKQMDQDNKFSEIGSTAGNQAREAAKTLMA